MPIPLERKDLLNPQQLEVAVHGPDGATCLILCSGIACMRPANPETYTFLVGPRLSRRQFVGVIASGALSGLRGHHRDLGKDITESTQANLFLIEAGYDEEARQVRVIVKVSFDPGLTALAVSYNISILAELPPP